MMPLKTTYYRLLCGAFLLSVLLLSGCASRSLSQAPGAQAAIASAHPLATTAGVEILQSGGNAFDAAVAVSAALAVVEPYSSGMGGGGFWLLHSAEEQKNIMLDGRERAPLKAHRDLYLDAKGDVIPESSINGPLAAGIPGQPAALAHLAKHYGRLSLQQTLSPAIRLAREGFPADEIYIRMAGWRKSAILESPEATEVLLHDGDAPVPGTLIKQPQLAATLTAIATSGHAGFYQGEVAEKLVHGVQKAGGIWTLQDLKEYRVVEREPVTADYQGMTVVSAAPPSSGGVVLAEIFNILETFPQQQLDEATKIHLIAEAMRRAYRDRAQYLGDPDFIEMPLKQLTSKEYAAGLAQSIRLDKATPSELLAPTNKEKSKGRDTTHFSIIDTEGNRVAATLSINYPFGSCFIPPGTGVILNNEMDDFSAKPGVPNVYGLVGAEANAIEPGKRMLSSMSPSFLETSDRVAIIGTPGGSRIITMLLVSALEFHAGKSAEKIVNKPRYHHQFLPDQIEFEKGVFSEAVQKALQQKGHRLKENDGQWGNMQAVIWNKANQQSQAASDQRAIGQAWTGSILLRKEQVQ